MTEQQLNEIEARLKKTTPGPWEVDTDCDVLATAVMVPLFDVPTGDEVLDTETFPYRVARMYYGDQPRADAEFIAHAKQDIEALLDLVRTYRVALKEATKPDGTVYEAGRAEGRTDIAVALRKVLDPTDSQHLNLDGSLKQVARLVAESASFADSLVAKFLDWRGIEKQEDICTKCQGGGKVAYGTWAGGAGGQTMAATVCDKCWGSGDKTKPFPDWRKIYTTEARKAEAAFRNGVEAMREKVLEFVKHDSLADGVGIGTQRLERGIAALNVVQNRERGSV
jgi:hypothetical protein